MKNLCCISSTTAALFLFAAAAHADVIYLLDGKSLDNVRIVDQTMKQISYREEGKNSNKTVDPDAVLKVEFTRKPEGVDAAETALDEGAILDAADLLEAYVGGILEGNATERRYPWAPAYAANLLIDLYISGGNHAGVIKNADRIIGKIPDSRYVPAAYLAKAEAQRLSGKGPAAIETLSKFRALIAAKALSKRWTLECDLAEILADAKLQGQAKRDRLIGLASEAGSAHPTVRNRARVAEGESYLEGQKKDFDSARKVFERIAADPKADRATLAGAYTGLGDCQFNEAVEQSRSNQDHTANLDSALENYLRVVVSYKEQQRYVAKAMFFAGRAFDFKGDGESQSRAKYMYRRVVQRFGDSPWAGEARKQLGG